MTRVLVVEDDENMRLAVEAQLRSAGLDVDSAGRIADADRLLQHRRFDCVVFDRMLPGDDGLDDAVEYVHGRRQRGWGIPVLFLSALDTPTDRVAGFEHGGDDYLVKPFAMAELTERVVNLCGRSVASRASVLRHADLEMDCARRQVRRGGVLLTLSNKEFAVLEQLLGKAGFPVSRVELLEHCWDEVADPVANVVDVTVKRLRGKLHQPELIHAVRGVGYRLGSA